jgi:hypothetical protein
VSPEVRGQYHQSWWTSWGKSTAFLLLGILGVLGAMFGALVILGIIF